MKKSVIFAFLLCWAVSPFSTEAKDMEPTLDSSASAAAPTTTSSLAEKEINNIVNDSEGEVNSDVQWVTEYIRRYTKLAPDWPPNKIVYERAPELAKIIVSVSEKMGIDYRITTVLTRCESGFREGSLTGKQDKGDFGLLQVHGDTSPTSESQLEAGLNIWKECKSMCRSLSGALTCYQTGRCSIPTVATDKLQRKARGVVYRLGLLQRVGVKPRVLPN